MSDPLEKKSEAIREKELIKHIVSTPAGKELIDIWINKLTRTKSFLPELSEAHCRYASGRHSIYIDFIKETKEK